MANLIPLSDFRNDNRGILPADAYDPTGETAYAADGQKVGKVRGVMVEGDTGRIRYLTVDVGGWFSSKNVLVPVGLARIEDDGVYFDTLTKEQVKDMSEYREGMDYDATARHRDDEVLRTGAYTTETTTRRDDVRADLRREDLERDRRADMSKGVYNYRDEDVMYKTPERLRLLEERLIVNKEKFVAGSVEVGKHVETRPEKVTTELSHDEVIIERHAGSGKAVEGDVALGSDARTVHVDLEAERANVAKEAFVREEVEVSKRTETERQTFTENVGREVLDVDRDGNARITGTDTDIDEDRKRR